MVLPNSREQMIQFFESHLSAWQANTVAIGLTVPQLTGLATQISKARAALNGAVASRLAAKSDTTTYHMEADTLRGLGQDLIDRVRIQAESTHNMGVYALAQIDPPSPPTSLPAPGRPEGIVATLNEFGQIHLSWKSKMSAPSSGAYFAVTRQLNGAGSFALIGAVAGRDFIDGDIPGGTVTIAYQIQGHRGDQAGEANDPFLVRFGTDGQMAVA